MVKIVIVTHGPLANAFKESSKMFFGDIDEDVITLGLFPNDSPDELQVRIENELKKDVDNKEFLFFVDIFAGTPFNVATMILSENLEKYNIECFTGINMPLLMEAISMRGSSSIAEITEHLDHISSDTIINVKKKILMG